MVVPYPIDSDLPLHSWCPRPGLRTHRRDSGGVSPPFRRRRVPVRCIAERTGIRSSPGSLADAVESGRDYTVGVRPEDVSVTNTGVETTVEVVEPVGADNYLYLDIEDGFSARVGAAVEPSMGETITVGFEESAVHVFDTDGVSLRDRGLQAATA